MVLKSLITPELKKWIIESTEYYLNKGVCSYQIKDLIFFGLPENFLLLDGVQEDINRIINDVIFKYKYKRG